MKRIEIKPGEEHGELTVIREAEVSASGKRQVLCECSCGNQVTVRLSHLRSGHSASCGRCGISYNGKRKTLVEWANEYGINKSTLRARLKIMDIGEALKRK